MLPLIDRNKTNTGNDFGPSVVGARRRFGAGLTLVLACGIGLSHASLAAADDACLLRLLRSAAGDTTVDELRASCAGIVDEAPIVASPPARRSAATDYERDVIGARRADEERIEATQFMLTPHAPNYFAYSFMRDANQAPYAPLTGTSDPVEEHEAVFQISIKAPLVQDLFGTDLDAYFAYTSKSWWQVANDDFSAPFRETNYQPEFFLRSDKERDFLGTTLAGWSLGIVHESNGREQALSRSWNRMEARAGFQLSDDLALLATTWYRFPEDEDSDNNPAMHRYLGYGDARFIWTPNRNTFTAMLNPTTESTNFELTWSYPISKAFRLYATYYDGKGESLIDYDFDMQRLSIGLTLNDYLTRY